MDDTLGDSLTIEMSEQIDQVEILEQERAILADPLEFLWVWNRSTVGSRVHGLLGILEGRGWLIVGNHYYFLKDGMEWVGRGLTRG